MTRSAVITGIGAIAPGGICRDAMWELLSQGRTATRAITLFDAGGFRSRIAAECDFDPVEAGLGPQEIRRMDRAAQFAVVSTREAWRTTTTPSTRPARSTGGATGSCSARGRR